MTETAVKQEAKPPKKSSLTFRTAALAAGKGMETIVRIVVAAVLARKLTEVQYGTFKQTFLVFGLLAPLLSLGLPGALLYFLPKRENRERAILMEVLLCLTAAGFMFSLFLLLGGADWIAERFSNPELSTTLRWLALVPPVLLIKKTVPTTLIAKAKAVHVAVYSVLSGLLQMVVVFVAIFGFSASALAAVIGTIIAEVILVAPAIYLLYGALSKGSWTAPRVSSLMEQTKYAVPLGIGSMIGVIHKLTDKAIVSDMTTPGEYAMFSNGAMEIPLVQLLTGSAAGVMLPEMSRLYSEGNLNETIGLFRRSAVKCGRILAPVAGWFFVSAPWVMTWLYGAGFLASTPIFRIYLLLIPIRVAFFGPLLQAAGRSDLVLARSIVGFIGNVVFTIALTKWLGPIGAAIGTVASIILFTQVYGMVQCIRVYKSSLREIVPTSELAKIFLPVFVVTPCTMLCSIWVGWETSLSVVGWIVISCCYTLLVLLAYHYLQVVSIPELWSQSKARVLGLLKR